MKSTTITCLACDHSHAVANPTDLDDAAFFVAGIFRCDECSARMSFGKLMPRIIVTPWTDENGVTWLRRRFQNPKTKEDLFVVDLDPQYAAMECKNTLSVVLP